MIDAILTARADAPFTSLFDLCERIDLRMCNKRVFEALTHSGALDSLGGHRSQFVAILDTALHEASLKQAERVSGQGSLFGVLDGLDGLQPFLGAANFLLIRGPEGLAGRLARRGVLVRGCGPFIGLGSEYFRIAVRGEDENGRLISALKEDL